MRVRNEAEMLISRNEICILVACLAGVCACSSPKIRYGGKGVVTYRQFGAEGGDPPLELVLVQDTHPDFETLLEAKGEHTFMKKTSGDLWNYLIDTLVEDCRFLDLAESVPTGEEITSPRVLSVKNEYGEWILQSEHAVAECECHGQRNYFVPMVDAFRHCFDSTFTLQPLEDGSRDGVQFFKDEQERLQKIGSSPVRD
jgi:hypothetical protein